VAALVPPAKYCAEVPGRQGERELSASASTAKGGLRTAKCATCA
jgi:hypothetical protein